MSLKENPQNYNNPSWDMSTGQKYQDFVDAQKRSQIYGNQQKSQTEIDAERLFRDSLNHPGQ